MTEPVGLKITLNPDGTITRENEQPFIPATGDQQPRNSVFSKDVPLNTNFKTWVRIFRPVSQNSGKIPIILFFHGGGFVLFSAGSVAFDEYCATMARELPAIVISVEYRLAPESPLPAAYDDAVEAIEWVKNQVGNSNGDLWLRETGDFDRCFLMGHSSGANIAYHAALRVSDLDLKPLRIVGLILNQPFFGGIERTDSELRLENDLILPLEVSDLMWKAALPSGSDRDHEFCNPLKGEIKGSLARCLLWGFGGDPLVDRQKEFVKMLGSAGVEVVSRFDPDGYHAVEFFNPDKNRALLKDMHHFISSTPQS